MSISKKVCLREGLLKDVDRIYRISKSSLPNYYAIHELNYFVKSPKYILVIVEKNDKAIGYVLGHLEKKKTTCSKRDYLRGHVMSFAVQDRYRRLGYGSLLMDKLESLFSSRYNISLMSLHVQTTNEKAINFYEKIGYKKYEFMKNYYFRLGDDGYLMCKIIRRKCKLEENKEKKVTFKESFENIKKEKMKRTLLDDIKKMKI